LINQTVQKADKIELETSHSIKYKVASIFTHLFDLTLTNLLRLCGYGHCKAIEFLGHSTIHLRGVITYKQWQYTTSLGRENGGHFNIEKL
jgi:hypothetical protein